MPWIHRIKRNYVERSSPRSMEASYGLSFVDGNGHATSNAEWIYNPDMSAVIGVPKKYLVITGDVVSEMSQSEKDAVDAILLATQRDNSVDAMIDSTEGDLRQLVKLMIQEINILRDLHSLPDRTIAQFKTQIRNGYGS